MLCFWLGLVLAVPLSILPLQTRDYDAMVRLQLTCVRDRHVSYAMPTTLSLVAALLIIASKTIFFLYLPGRRDIFH